MKLRIVKKAVRVCFIEQRKTPLARKVRLDHISELEYYRLCKHDRGRSKSLGANRPRPRP